MTLYEKIINFLNTNNISYEEIHHKAVYTSEEATKVRGCKPQEGAKALVFWADKKPIQIIIEGNKKIDKKVFKNQFDVKDLRMVSKEDLLEISGVEPGAVPPFGNLFNTKLKIYCNKSLFENEFIEFNAGDHCISIRMRASDWQKAVKPTLGDFALDEIGLDPIKSPTLLAIDYGTKKIGLALYKNDHAAPLKVLDNKPGTGIETEALNQIAKIAREEKIKFIIIGLPLVSGQENKETKKVREFGNLIKKKTNLKVVYVDESHSTDDSMTSLIIHGVSRKKRARDDSFSAITILSRYLEKL